MNVKFENVSKVQGLLTISMEKADYQENVDKALKDARKKVQMPGFRPGMVPMSLVQKMYGKSIKADEINKILQEKIYSYIKENKIDMLGEPLANDEKEAGMSLDDDNLTFYFDIALAPQFNAEIGKDDTITYYEIKVTEEMVNNQVKAYAQQNGKYEQVDSYQENDVIKGQLVELNADGTAKDGGIVVEGAT
ncbi:MAG: trigger factor family protein, partial [Bacteroidaceae bacterium]|nr:trigger factor family protein [Bacteroidaceae bacterium]